MGILSGIKTFINEKILGVNNNTEVNTATKTAKPNEAIIKCDAGKNVDTVEIKNKQIPKENQKTEKSHRTSGLIKQSIAMKCKAYNINFAQMANEFAKIAGMSKEEFEALPEKEKETILTIVECEIDKFAKTQEKYGASSKINNAKMISANSQNMVEAEKNGISQNEVDKEAGDVNKELGTDFKNLDKQEQRKRMEEIKLERETKFEKRLQARLAKVPASKRKAVEARMRRVHNFAERARFGAMLVVHDSKTALHAISMLNAKDMAYGIKKVLETRIDKKEATETADNANFNYTTDLLKTYHDRKEKPSKDVITEYTAVNIGAKSAEAVIEYQNDYNENRKAFEKDKNATPYLDDEFFTSTAKGIGEGVLNNTNMSTEEKAEFISKWKDDAQQYKDRDIVTKEVDEKLKNNVEYKDIAEKVKTIEKNKVVYKQTESNNNVTVKNKKTINTENRSFVTEVITNENSSKLQKKETNADQGKEETKKVDTEEISKENSKIVIANNVRTLGYEKAVNEYGHTAVIDTILNDKSLSYMRPKVKSFIKSTDPDTIVKLAKDCSKESYKYICRIVPKEVFEKLKDVRSDLCYADRQDMKNMEEQYA